MRIIHTSDWHLGQYFFGKTRLDEHRAFLDWLLQQVEQYQVDAVIVAGDIFDTGAPPSYARQLYNQFIVNLQHYDCQLLVLGGNHDSVTTLEESRDLVACLNTTVLAGVSDNPEDQVVVLKSRDGEPGAVVCAIPFIRPRDLVTSIAGQSGTDKQVALQQAIAEHYQQIYQLAQAKKESLGGRLPIVATGHLTAMGVSKSESVRDIYVGTLEAFAADEFPPADYIALGHIHRAQSVAKSNHIRYCGSPIHLSFDEIGQRKCVLMVDFADGKLADIEPLEIPIFQPMQMLKGDLEQIQSQLASLSADGRGKTTWLDIEVSTQDYLSDLQSRVEQLTEGLPVEVLVLRRQRSAGRIMLEASAKRTLSELNAFEVFDKRLALEVFESDSDKQRLKRIKTAFAEVVDEAQVQLQQELQS